VGVHGNLLFAIVLELLAIMIEFFQTSSTIFQDAMTASSQHNAKQHIRAILISNEVASIDISARYPACRIWHPVIKIYIFSGQMMLLSILY
jgi:hypothetical protein